MFCDKSLVIKFCNKYESVLTRNQRVWYLYDGEHWIKAGKKLDAMIKKHLRQNDAKVTFGCVWWFKADIAKYLKYAHEV